MTISTSDRIASEYGVRQTNGIEDGYNFDRVDMSLAEFAAKGRHVTRVRLLTEMWPTGRKADISYIHGVLADGTPVRLYGYPAANALRDVKGDLIEWAKEEKVYAKGLGLLDDINWSILY